LMGNQAEGQACADPGILFYLLREPSGVCNFVDCQ
jgi:hypothetical protein